MVRDAQRAPVSSGVPNDLAGSGALIGTLDVVPPLSALVNPGYGWASALDQSKRSWRAALGLVFGLVVLLWSGAGAAHDLAIDRLTLWIEPASATLRGQMVFDPELTRSKDAAATPEAERRALEFLRRHLTIEADGKRLVLEYELRELWQPAGATPGDSVMLKAPLSRGARELRVQAPEPMKALVVSVQTRAPNAESTRSTLVLGGQWTAPYRLDSGEPAVAWREGGADQFSLDAGTGQPPRPAPEARARSGSAPEAVAASPWQQAARYVWLGVVHILPRGWDHVLFVAGLVLGSGRRLRPLLLQLSAFTVAHSITLALGALGWVVLPGRLVEILIAVSIAVVALENLASFVKPKYRVWVVLCFGLLHGQGFARVLGELALPQQSFLVALVSFNVGVELGQLIVVGVLLLACYPLKNEATFKRYVLIPGSLFIGAMGLYWAVERLLG